MAIRDSINTRVPRRVKQVLEQMAKDRRINPLTFARTLLDEGYGGSAILGSYSGKGQPAAALRLKAGGSMSGR